jgi:hypothetical protein
MDLENLLRFYSDVGSAEVYVKQLSPNDNSKNQIYLGGSFDVLNIFPSEDIVTDSAGPRKKQTLKSKIDFNWINEDYSVSIAPHSQLILYPEYPEVRFSGFLRGSNNGYSHLLSSREEGRLLFLGVGKNNKIYGYVASSQSDVALNYHSKKGLETHGVFKIIKITDTKYLLLQELQRIHNLHWICSKRLNPKNEIVPCVSSNCGGYTLEAEMNIPSNSTSGPDFLGWEIKQFRVNNFNKFGSSPISLMDHSPNGGYFFDEGPAAFIKKYGYADKKGRASRLNFGGTHKFNTVHHLTSLKLLTFGFDILSRTIDPQGFVGLIDTKENIAASWSFKSIIDHWKKKHPQACYVPSRIRKGNFEKCNQQYFFGNKIILGKYTDVSLFLYELSLSNIVYDPGIKLELAIEGERKQETHVRSLFRTKPNRLPNLYFETEIITLETNLVD